MRLDEPAAERRSATSAAAVHAVAEAAVQRAPRRGSHAGAPSSPLIPTVFHTDWWLDIAYRGRHQEITVDSGGRMVGRWPFCVQRHRGFDVSRMASLVPIAGPAIDEGEGSTNTRLLRRFDLVSELIGKLPKLSSFAQTLHGGLPDTLPFQAGRFETSAQFTMDVLPAAEPTLWSAMRDKTRNVIRRTRERCSVAELDDPEAFVAFYRRNLEGERSYFDLDRVPALYAASQARGCGRILAARDAQQALLAAIFVVDDARASYYLLSTRDPGSGDNGAVSLLLWEAIRTAAANGRRFDFGGIAGMGSARFYAGFGAQMSTRLTIWRSSHLFRLGRVVSAAMFGDRRNLFVGESW